MNFYALNVAPINGWETHLGMGGASLVVTAQGVARTEMHPAGTAAMALTASGIGAVSPLNAAMAAIELQATDVSINAIAVLGTGTLEMALNAKYGIPARPPRSGTIENKRDRSMLVASEPRAFTVLAEVEMRLRKREPLRVARERRS